MSHELTLNELPAIHGAMAEFDTPEDLLAACERAYAEGYRRMDAYAPMPVTGLAEAIGYKKNKVAFCVLIAGIVGACGGFGLLEWITVVAYPHNVGGRPLNSWPAYIPITFECMVLIAGLTSLFSHVGHERLAAACIIRCLMYRHSTRASIDKFFLCIESSDPEISNRGHFGISAGDRSKRGDRCSGVRAAIVLVGMACLTGCRQDMHNQPRYKPLAATTFSAMDVRRGRPSRIPSRAASCTWIRRVTRARRTGKTSTTSRFRSREPMWRAEKSGSISIVRRVMDAWAMAQGMIVRRGFRPASQLSRSAIGQRARGTFFRRYDKWIWRDVQLCVARSRRRPLANRGLYPRASIEPERSGGFSATERNGRRAERPPEE